MRFCPVHFAFRLLPFAFCLSLALDFACAASAQAQPPRASFELPVTGGQAALEHLGIRQDERGMVLLLMARALHGAVATGTGAGLAVTFTELFGAVTTSALAPSSDGPGAVVLAPFSDVTWRRVMQLGAGADLFTAIVRNRGALLVAASAIEANPDLREWLEREPRLLQQVVGMWPGAFAQVASNLSITDGRIVVPGGTPLESAWTALVGVPSSRPDEFLRRLLARDDGRLARFYATVGRLDEPRRAALLQPLQGEDAAAALAAVYRISKDADAPWPPNLHPYQLSYADLPSVLHALSDLPIDRWPGSAADGRRCRATSSRAPTPGRASQAPATHPYAAVVRHARRPSARAPGSHDGGRWPAACGRWRGAGGAGRRRTPWSLRFLRPLPRARRLGDLARRGAWSMPPGAWTTGAPQRDRRLGLFRARWRSSSAASLPAARKDATERVLLALGTESTPRLKRRRPVRGG
jgi:hypothetical protein